MKYVDDYSAAYGADSEGHYLVLHVDTTDVSAGSTVEVVNSTYAYGPRAIDLSDGIVICRISDNIDTETIQFKLIRNGTTYTKDFDISGLILAD